MSQLYGKSLANQIPDSTTGNQARLAFGGMTSALHSAYLKLGEYDPTGLGDWTGIDAGSGQAAKQYLDDANGILSTYYAQMPVDDAPLSSQLLTKLKVAASTSSVAVKYIDDNFSTSFLAELADSVIEACATVVGKVANTVSKVAGSFLGGTWWIWVLVAVGVVLVKGTRKTSTGGAP